MEACDFMLAFDENKRGKKLFLLLNLKFFFVLNNFFFFSIDFWIKIKIIFNLCTKILVFLIIQLFEKYKVHDAWEYLFDLFNFKF